MIPPRVLPSLLLHLIFSLLHSSEGDPERGREALATRCSEPLERGFTCSEAPRRQVFAFDVQRRQCRPLFYQGCGGNGNRFDTVTECRSVCMAPKKGLLEELCHFRTGAAIEDSDLRLKECREDGDCSSRKCRRGKCCPGDEVCALPADSGHESAAAPLEHSGRFAFDERLGACIRFSYFGVGGNLNNFVSHGACTAHCGPVREHKP